MRPFYHGFILTYVWTTGMTTRAENHTCTLRFAFFLQAACCEEGSMKDLLSLLLLYCAIIIHSVLKVLLLSLYTVQFCLTRTIILHMHLSF